MLRRIVLPLCLCVLVTLYSCVAAADSNFVNRPDVQNFIHHMVKKYGFNEDQLDSLFSHVTIRPRVLQSVKAPLEQQPWYTYQTVFITESRIRQGVDFWNRNAVALERAEKIYGVPASIIVATIGVETKYGKNKGEYLVIDALSNIGFSDSHRAGYFLSELEEFLLLCREQHLDPFSIKGSYAGAMGQPQFMPSSYRRYAVSFYGNSKVDLSNNDLDIIVSIANYYKKHGWTYNEAVAVPAAVEKDKYQALLSLNQPLVVYKTDLSHYGIIPYSAVPSDQKIKVLELEGYHGNEYWLSLHNFDVIKRYNPSDLYAMAVYQLSYYITALRERVNRA